jgi:hypothetical protein
MQQNISRRATLAALAFAGTAIAPLGALAMGGTLDRTAWDRAFLAYQRAKAARDHFERTHMAPANAAFRAALPDGGEGGIVGKSPAYRELWHAAYDRHIGHVALRGEPIDEISTRLTDAVTNKALALHRLPAPDNEALLWKLADLWADEPTASYGGGMVEQVLDDARRLLSNGRA